MLVGGAAMRKGSWPTVTVQGNWQWPQRLFIQKILLENKLAITTCLVFQVPFLIAPNLRPPVGVL